MPPFSVNGHMYTCIVLNHDTAEYAGLVSGLLLAMSANIMLIITTCLVQFNCGGRLRQAIPTVLKR
jgi:hypothetical protein